MKDLHNHFLYAVDDGSKNLDTSISILNDLKRRGVTSIVATPHYIIGTNYNSNNKDKLKKLKELQKHTEIKLYLGNEVYIDNDIIDYISKNEISTINNSRYLLIELPLNENLNCTNDIIFRLRNNGIIPIIAHPERYSYLSIRDLEKLIEQGCLFQGNISSLSNKYRKKVKHNFRLLLKKHMIHVLGTDTHRPNSVDLNMCIDELKKIVDDKMYNELMETNFDKIINDEVIIPYEIIPTNHLFRREKIK